MRLALAPGLLFGALLIAVSCATGCRRDPTPAASEAPPSLASAHAPTVRIVTFVPKGIDPGTVGDGVGRKIAENCFEGLTTRAADGSVVPGLAAKWASRADGLVWTFELRPGLTWSDGEPITANDIVWSFQRAVDPKTGNPNAAMYDVIAGAKAAVEGKQPTTAIGAVADTPARVVLTLERPDPDLPRRLATAYLAPVPRHAVEKYGEKWTRPENIVVSGPYRPTAEKNEASLTLEKNPRFHDATSVAIERIEYRFTSDTATAWQWYSLGEVDIVDSLVPQETVESLREANDPALRTSVFDGVFFLFANASQGPLSDARVRRAIDLAVDRGELTRHVTAGGERPAYTIMPARLAPPIAPRGRDLGKAKALLTEAGYGPGKPLTLSLWFNTNQRNLRVAEFLARNLSEGLGITITLNNVEWGSFLDALDQGRTELAQLNMGGYDALDFLGLVESGPTANRAHWTSADYDAAMADFRKARTADEQAAAITKAEAVLARERPVIPLFQPMRQNLVRPGLLGFSETPDDIHPIRWMRWQ